MYNDLIKLRASKRIYDNLCCLDNNIEISFRIDSIMSRIFINDIYMKIFYYHSDNGPAMIHVINHRLNRATYMLNGINYNKHNYLLNIL